MFCYIKNKIVIGILWQIVTMCKRKVLRDVYQQGTILKIYEQRNILHEIRERKASLIGHILRRNCFLQRVIEGKIKRQIKVTRRRGRRRKKLLDDLKDRRGFCHLKEEALDRAMWRNLYGRSFGRVVWQITYYDDVLKIQLFSLGYRHHGWNEHKGKHLQTVYCWELNYK